MRERVRERERPGLPPLPRLPQRLRANRSRATQSPHPTTLKKERTPGKRRPQGPEAKEEQKAQPRPLQLLNTPPTILRRGSASGKRTTPAPQRARHNQDPNPNLGRRRPLFLPLPPAPKGTTIRAPDGLSSQRPGARPDKPTPSPALPEEGVPKTSRTTHTEMRGSDPHGMLPAGPLYRRAPMRPPTQGRSGVMTAPSAPRIHPLRPGGHPFRAMHVPSRRMQPSAEGSTPTAIPTSHSSPTSPSALASGYARDAASPRTGPSPPTLLSLRHLVPPRSRRRGAAAFRAVSQPRTPGLAQTPGVPRRATHNAIFGALSRARTRTPARGQLSRDRERK